MDADQTEKCHVFICYRQQDGLAVAEWLYQQLHGRTIQLERSNETLQLDVYFDRDAPAVDDWQEIWLPKLQVARALLFVCTPSASKRRDGTDWVYRELDKWIALRQSGPIVIDATGEAEKYLPRILQERWPNAQRITCRPQVWRKLPEEEHHQEAKRVIGRIMRGIRISEEGYWLEELERLKKLNRKLKRRLVAMVALFVLAVVLAILSRVFQLQAEREATIATAGQLRIRSEFLRQQDGPSLESSVLFAMRSYQLYSKVGAPSIDAWRALKEGIELLPGKVGIPFYPFGRDVPARAYIGEKAVLFVRNGKPRMGEDKAALWSPDDGDVAWRRIHGFNTDEHGELVNMSADGRWLVTNRSGSLVVWNTADGEILREIQVPTGRMQKPIVALSPSGRWLGVVAGREFHVHDLHAEPDAPYRSFAVGWPEQTIFSPNDQHLAYADKAQLTLYSLQSGEILRQAKMPPDTDQVDAPIFSPDGEYVAIHVASNQVAQMAPSATPGGVNHKVLMWRISEQHRLPVATTTAGWQPYETTVREDRFDIVFSPTLVTPKVAILAQSQPVQVLDLFSKDSYTLSAADQGAQKAAFTPRGLLTVNYDGTARLWDMEQRVELRRLIHERPVSEAHFLPGRNWGAAQILTVSDDGEVRLWSEPDNSLVVAVGTRHVIKWNSSGDYILSADTLAYRTDARTGEQVQIPLKIEPDHRCVAGALSPDGRHAVFATKWAPPGQPQTLRLVDISGENKQMDLPLEAQVEVQDIAVAVGGSPVLAVDQKGVVLIWTPGATADNEKLRTFAGNDIGFGALRDSAIVLLDPDAGSFLRVSGGNSVKAVCRAASGKILNELQIQTHWNPRLILSSWMVSNSGKYFSFQAENGQLYLVQTRDLNSTKIAPAEKARLLQVDNDGCLLLRSENALLVVNREGKILYRLADTSAPDKGHLSRNGTLLAAVEGSGVKVWDLNKDLLLADLPVTEGIRDAAFGPDADLLVLLHSNRFSVRRWKGEDMVQLAGALIGRALTEEEWRIHLGTTPMR